MKALLWKEFRETAKWALIAMVVFGAALAFGLYYSQGNYGYDYYDGITVTKGTFLMATTFGAPAVALLLAFLQTIPELKTDRWAALLHRPVAATSVFWAKAITGTAFYFLAVGLPYLVLVALVATPGQFAAPFIPEMLKPSIIDLTAGLMYYFAALAVALQRGRAVFLRPFPLLAALHVSFYAMNAQIFHVALEAVLAMNVALLVAAWGVMRCRECFTPRPWLAKVAYAIVLFYGACGLGALGLLLIGSFAPKPTSTYHRWELTKSGLPVHLVYENSKVKAVLLPDGSVPTDPKYKPSRISAELERNNSLSSYVGDAHGYKPSTYASPYREPYAYVSAGLQVRFPRIEQWFYLHQNGTYVSYLPDERTAVDRIDNAGFQPLSALVQSFPAGNESTQMSASYVFGWQDSLRFFYLDRREVVTPPLPAPGPIYGVSASWAYLDNAPVYALSVALRNGIAVYSEAGALLTFLPYHYDVDRWGSLTLGVNAALDRFQIYYKPSIWIDRATKDTMSSYVETVDLKGNVLSSYELPPLPKDRRGTSFTSLLSRRTQSLGMYLGESAYQKIGALLGSERLARADRSRWTTGWRNTREILLWATGCALVFALLTFLATRRSHFSPCRSWTWTLLVFLFGLPGFIAFLVAVDWPARVACPTCGRRRPVHEKDCPACAAAWPSPPADGLEIFDHPAIPAPPVA